MKRILISVFLMSIVLLGAETVIDESFDSMIMPDGWTQIHEAGNISWMPYSGGHNGNPEEAHSGDRNAYIFAETCTTKLVTPMLNIGGSTGATLTFWHAHVSWAGHQDILRVYYKTQPDANWTLIDTYDDDLDTWTYETINLPFESSSYFIAFEAECDWGHGVVVDDVVIEGDPSPVGVVEGYVYNEGGIPLTGAEVLIEDVSMSTTTAPGGFYQILGVPEGQHHFFASLDGYGFDMVDATVIAGQTTTLDFNLQEYIEVIVNGTVVDHEFGDPVQGATIELSGFEDYEAQTAANGQFIIPGVYSNNTYDLTVTKPGHNPYEETITVAEVNYACGTIVVFAPVTINGMVNTTAHPDSGLGNAEVTLEGDNTYTVQTAANGQFLIEDVYANDTYHVTVTYDNHNPYDEYENIGGVSVDLGTLTVISPVALTGHVVTNANPEIGLADADVSLTGYANHSTTTDSLGNFIIEEIYAHELYELTVEFANHNTHVQNVNILEEDLDIGTISLIGPVMVSGYIYGSDNLETGLAEADVSLSGYANHSTTTDSTGYYFFADVFANEEYTIQVEAENYNTYEADIDVADINLVVADIIVEEATSPASNVVATVFDNSAAISWNPPGSSETYEFRYDDGNPVSQIGINDTRAVIGAAHPYYAVIDEVQWYLTNAHTHPTVKVYIFGLDADGLPNSDDLLYQSGNISNTNNQWRTHYLPNPIAAPNGFLVGVSTPSRYTDVAMDDGNDAPWLFQTGTQFGISDYLDGDWVDISSFPDAGNLLIRAYGLYLGPPMGRVLEGYNLFRLPEEELSDPDDWELLAENIQDTTFTDTTWWHLDEGNWYYAVCCQHTNGIQSIASFSNELEKDDPPTFIVNLNVTNNSGEIIQYANGRLESFYHTYTATSNANGVAQFPSINPGIYHLEVTRNGYDDYYMQDLLITEDTEMDITLISVGTTDNQIEAATKLNDIYPNPFNPETNISFQMAQDGHVVIDIYNLKGQKIVRLADNEFSAGEHSIVWNADNLPSSMYLVRFQSETAQQLQKVILLK